LDPAPENIPSELTRRHKAASRTVLGLIVTTMLLSVVAFLSKNFLTQKNNPSVDIAVRITILILGLGSIAWRRTKFSGMRLQDIGALRGGLGLLRTLENTTVQIAFLGASIALIGFIATLMTGNDLYTYWAAAISLVVLIYCYPTKSSWSRTVERFSETAPNDPS
jgi:hypothetical protein